MQNVGHQCNCCRVRYQFLLSISLCYVLITPRYHVSKPRALSPFAIVSFLDKRELITKVIAKVILRLVYSGVQKGQSVSVYLFPCRFRCIS